MVMSLSDPSLWSFAVIAHGGLAPDAATVSISIGLSGFQYFATAYRFLVTESSRRQLADVVLLTDLPAWAAGGASTFTSVVRAVYSSRSSPSPVLM